MKMSQDLKIIFRATCVVSAAISVVVTESVADPGEFHWFPRKPPFKSEDYFNTYIYAAIKNILKNILCTVTQPFLIN